LGISQKESDYGPLKESLIDVVFIYAIMWANQDVLGMGTSYSIFLLTRIWFFDPVSSLSSCRKWAPHQLNLVLRGVL
jgi:hypothetical protein